MHYPGRVCVVLACLLLVAAGLLTGCGSGLAQNTMPAVTAPDPTGGQWLPVIVPSAAQITVPAPPADNSSQTLQELASIRGMQALRTPAQVAQVQAWDQPVLRWNAFARSLVASHATTPPPASRIYALLSVAQYDALVVTWANKYRYSRRPPSALCPHVKPVGTQSGDPVYPDAQAVLAAVSAPVLTYLYPDSASAIANFAQQELAARMLSSTCFPSDLPPGQTIGSQVADLVIAYAKADNSNVPWTGTVPTGTDIWFSSAVPPKPPLLPNWGLVHPWLMSSGDEFRPGPPPAFGSPDFLAGLAVVRNYALNRTPDEIAIAKFWEDGSGTATPPGHWNQIAADAISATNWNELRSARALALINMAQADGCISCWDAKYTYWAARPSQVDPTITLAIALPNFPSYFSGHSTFSGAASTVLNYLFPAQSHNFTAMAEQAGISRVYGGIHFPFDNTTGLQIGRTIGQLAVTRAHSDGAP